jgi:hypothetical protein
MDLSSESRKHRLVVRKNHREACPRVGRVHRQPPWTQQHFCKFAVEVGVNEKHIKRHSPALKDSPPGGQDTALPRTPPLKKRATQRPPANDNHCSLSSSWLFTRWGPWCRSTHGTVTIILFIETRLRNDLYPSPPQISRGRLLILDFIEDKPLMSPWLAVNRRPLWTEFQGEDGQPDLEKLVHRAAREPY